MHNHPSGDPAPSQADIDMTRAVAKALQPVGITVHDHIVIGRGSHSSFRTLAAPPRVSAVLAFAIA
jgi:DNA repair protein RadC